jgi:hypothetical protein
MKLRASSHVTPPSDRRPVLRTEPTALQQRSTPAPVPGHPVDRSRARKPARKVRGTFSLTRELLDEIRNAAFHLSGPPLRLTMASLAERALRREVDRLKQLHNFGRAFPARTADLTVRRPLGS